MKEFQLQTEDERRNADQSKDQVRCLWILRPRLNDKLKLVKLFGAKFFSASTLW